MKIKLSKIGIGVIISSLVLAGSIAYYSYTKYATEHVGYPVYQKTLQRPETGSIGIGLQPSTLTVDSANCGRIVVTNPGENDFLPVLKSTDGVIFHRFPKPLSPGYRILEFVEFPGSVVESGEYIVSAEWSDPELGRQGVSLEVKGKIKI